MGAVYKGTQLSLNRKVAIKVLPPEFGRDPAFAERFKREAHALAELKHPNIVDIYDFGQTGSEDDAGHYYFVMEFVDGMDFHQLIQAKKLDIPGALNAVSQICDALAYAHGKGYIHRDIKPANIFLNYEGQVKVGDFGLAKLIDPPATDPDASAAADVSPGLTITGTAMGTPFYSAPEQLRGMGEVDQRSDIYNLGVMFYEMLTGSIPQGAFEPPSKKVEIDVRVDEVVLRAMAEEPDPRYPTAAELRTDVDAIRTGEVDVAVASSRRARELLN
ncbi:MAG: serine/threonine protein kinase [Verrucomicrobiales bacterium]|jgi:serine/threonine protein kinase